MPKPREIEITVRTSGPTLGEIEEDAVGSISVRPTALGLVVSEHVDKIGFFEPALEVVEKDLQPDRIRFVVRFAGELTKPLEEVVRGYKIGCFKIAREYRLISPIDPQPLFDAGFASRPVLPDAKRA